VLGKARRERVGEETWSKAVFPIGGDLPLISREPSGDYEERLHIPQGDAATEVSGQPVAGELQIAA
jgi:hypothetical protein